MQSLFSNRKEIWGKNKDVNNSVKLYLVSDNYVKRHDNQTNCNRKKIAQRYITSFLPLLRGLSSTLEYCLIFPTPIIVPHLLILLYLTLVLLKGGGLSVFQVPLLR